MISFGGIGYEKIRRKVPCEEIYLGGLYVRTGLRQKYEIPPTVVGGLFQILSTNNSRTVS